MLFVQYKLCKENEYVHEVLITSIRKSWVRKQKLKNNTNHWDKSEFFNIYLCYEIFSYTALHFKLG